MTQNERRMYLIRRLLQERGEYQNSELLSGVAEQKALLRSLMNLRLPETADPEFLTVQDEYLKQEIAEKGITDYKSLKPIEPDLYLWKGDITTLKCDAIVNAANSQMLGCFFPCHGCIDNAIHTFAGVQLRQACDTIMKKQGFLEPIGKAKLTPAFNLPCRYILHTVGPSVRGALTKKDELLLSSCYRSCLEAAVAHSLSSIAFCSISTGEFHFPNQRAAEIAVDTVRRFKKETQSRIEVIFNVFKELDLHIYRNLFR